jgi:hypothetical protein
MRLPQQAGKAELGELRAGIQRERPVDFGIAALDQHVGDGLFQR